MSEIDFSIVALEASLDAKIERYFDTLDTDYHVLKQLLADNRSENTRRAYERDVNDFLKTMTGTPAVPDNVLEFLHLSERQAVSVVLKYKAKLIDKGLKEATVNRWLATVKSLVEMGRKLGACHYSLEDIKGEKVTSYRDTTGVDRPTFVSKKVKISPTINAICLPIYREINQGRSGYLPSRELLVSPWSARENQRAADLGKLSAICVFMSFYAFL